MVGVGGNLVRVHLRHSMTHGCMADPDSLANTNTVTDADTVANSDTMADSNAMSKPSKELRSGRCRGCQGRNDQRSLKILGLKRSDGFRKLIQYDWMEKIVDMNLHVCCKWLVALTSHCK